MGRLAVDDQLGERLARRRPVQNPPASVPRRHVRVGRAHAAADDRIAVGRKRQVAALRMDDGRVGELGRDLRKCRSYMYTDMHTRRADTHSTSYRSVETCAATSTRRFAASGRTSTSPGASLTSTGGSGNPVTYTSPSGLG